MQKPLFSRLNYKLGVEDRGRGRDCVSSLLLHLQCLTDDLKVLGAQLIFWMKEMDAV